MRHALPSLALALLLAACGGAAPAGDPGSDFPPYPPGQLACAGTKTSFTDHLLIGYAGDLSQVGASGFSLRYQYISGVLAPSGAGCLDPARANAKNCGTAWWGTWQDLNHPPGEFVQNWAGPTVRAGLRPMLTYYVLNQAAQARLGTSEGVQEVTVAARNLAFMTDYLADFRLLLRKLGTTSAIVHIEPDFWAYAQRAGADPTALAAEVATANPTDCAGQPNSIAGLGRCMIAMVRLYAPNALVSLHGSSWSTGPDCVSNTQASLDVAAEARKTASFLEACGGGDLVVMDISDRDAGWYQTQGRNSWLDATDTKLPTFAQAFAWSRALTAQLRKPGLWWQVPVGNELLGSSCGGWKDNKLDYFLDHPDRVAASGAFGVAFGSGATCQTSPETDGWRLKARAAALAAVGGQPLCAP